MPPYRFTLATIVPSSSSVELRTCTVACEQVRGRGYLFYVLYSLYLTFAGNNFGGISRFRDLRGNFKAIIHSIGVKPPTAQSIAKIWPALAENTALGVNDATVNYVEESSKPEFREIDIIDLYIDWFDTSNNKIFVTFLFLYYIL